MILRCTSLITVLGAALFAGACASVPESAEVEIAPGSYARAFDAARDVVRHHRFAIDRVDGAAGVIASFPKQSSGILTPWDTDQSTTSQELDDTFNVQQRRVRVTFEPRGSESAGNDGARTVDLRSFPGAMACRFEVVIDRVERPDRRVPTRAVRQGSQAYNPTLRERGMWPTYAVPVSQDPGLAARLAQELREALEKPDASPAITPGAEPAGETTASAPAPPA